MRKATCILANKQKQYRLLNNYYGNTRHNSRNITAYLFANRAEVQLRRRRQKTTAKNDGKTTATQTTATP
jgi:hypothetical protein